MRNGSTPRALRGGVRRGIAGQRMRAVALGRRKLPATSAVPGTFAKPMIGLRGLRKTSFIVSTPKSRIRGLNGACARVRAPARARLRAGALPERSQSAAGALPKRSRGFWRGCSHSAAGALPGRSRSAPSALGAAGVAWDSLPLASSN